MVDEIVFWLICAIAAAGVWWAFFGRRHATVTAHTDLHRERPRQAWNQGLPRPLGRGVRHGPLLGT